MLLAGLCESAVAALTPVTGSPFATGSAPFSVAFSPGGGLLATANSTANTASVFSVDSGGALTQVTGSPFATGSAPHSVAFSADGGLFATANYSANTVSVFSVGSGGALTQVTGSPFATGRSPNSVAFSSAGGLLATANSGAADVSVFSVGSGGALTQVTGSPFATGSTPYGVAFSPDGGLLATANYGNSTLSLFSVGSGGALTQVTGSPYSVCCGSSRPYSVAFSPGGGLLATANNATSTASVFSVGAGGALTPVTGSPFATGRGPFSVAFSPDGGLLATGNYSANNVSLFSVGSGGALTQMTGSPFATGTQPRSVAFSPAGGLLATANSGANNVSVFAVSNLTLATQASGSIPLGGQISASATLAGGSSPTGTLTFNVYAPGDTACSASLATSTATVTGNGSYTSAPFTPTVPGVYTWTASYSGDANNAPVGATSCSNPASQVTVTAQGEISGTVTNTSGTPLANVCVYPYASGATGARTSDPGVCTDASGDYTLKIAATGSYNLAFYDPSGTYLTQWYNGASSESAATAVSVTSNAVTSGINATMSGQSAITGTVTNASGTPLANICVYLYASGATGARTGDTGSCTGSNGTYSMPVAAAGSYNVVFVDPSGTYLTQWYNGASAESSATPVTVTSGAATVNATMTVPTAVSGTVTNAAGSPLSNICVYLYGSGATGARTGDTGTCTNSSGQYSMAVGSAGSYNVVFYDPSGLYLTQWYNAAGSEATATAVSVTSGASTTGIDATMSEQLSITGTVTNASSTPLANICVYVYASGASGARTGDTGTCTNAAGQYSMSVASAGSYNVVFVDPSGTYLTQWNSGAASEASATAVTVAGGAPTAVNATMTAPTEISGSVTNASGAPLSNICVYLYAAGPSGSRTGDTGTCTNAAGQYTMSVGSAGSYNVVFYDPNGFYVTQWFSGQASEATATSVTVTSGATTANINASMSL